MKIDTSKIEGYEGMTESEKLEALSNYDIEIPDTSKLKNALSKANSECAEWKRKYNDTLNTEEQNKQAKEEEFKQLTEELASLKKANAISNAKSKFLSLGYDEETASNSAECLINSDYDKLFENQQKFLQWQEKRLKADLLKRTPEPSSVQNTEHELTKAEFKKMNAKERLKFFKEKPDEYAKMYKE